MLPLWRRRHGHRDLDADLLRLLVRVALALAAALLGVPASPRDLPKPLERQVADASSHSTGQAQRDARSAPSLAGRLRPVRKLEVLPDRVKERVERNLNG